jgi:hypothetical protein
VWTVMATMNDVAALGDQLAAAGVQKVTLESTSVIRGRQRALRHGGSKMFGGLGVSVADWLSGGLRYGT